MDFSDLTQSGLHGPSLDVLDAAAQNMESVEPGSIGALVPTKGILNGGEVEGARGLKLVVTAPEDTEVLVAGEASLLARMLINLADNAIKYADPAGTIELSVTSEGDKAAVCVTNCGPDIPEAAITELFERFTRAGGHAGSTEGAGLGLAFVATVAARHGGSASCSSGGGMTAFTVTLPLARDPAAQ